MFTSHSHLCSEQTLAYQSNLQESAHFAELANARILLYLGMKDALLIGKPVLAGLLIV